jgi:outer membrane protein TolC
MSPRNPLLFLCTSFVFGPVLTSKPVGAQPVPPDPPAAEEPPTPPAAAPAPAPPAPETAPKLEARLSEVLARPGGLTSGRMAERAVATSFDVQAKQRAVEVAAAGVDKVLTSYFPELVFVGRYTRLSDLGATPVFGDRGSIVVDPSGTAGPLPAGSPLVGIPASSLSFTQLQNQYYLQAGLVVPLSDYVLRTRHAHAAAKHGVEAARLGVRATQLATATNARLVYYAWVRARLQQVVAEQALDEAQEHQQVARLAFEVGRASNADVAGAEAGVANAELFVAQAKRMTATTEDVVRTAMHDGKPGSYQIGEDVVVPVRPSDTTGSIDALYAEAVRQRLELRSFDLRTRALDRQRSAAKSAGYPRLSAFGNAYYANPHPRVFPQQEEWRSSWDAGLQLTWTPNGLLASNAETNSIDAQRAELLAERHALEDRLRAEVMDSHQALLEAAASVESAGRALAAAEEAYRVRRLLFENGHATSLELSEEETKLLRARLQKINAHVNLLVARARLEHAVGRDAR